MRLCVTLDNPAETALPVNYQHLLTAAVYGLLGASDTEYARSLHDDGYAGGGGRRFKLFAFSWLRGRFRVAGPTIRYAPGPLQWQVTSPVGDFVRHLATGLLTEGALRVGGAAFAVQAVEALPAAELGGGPARFTCLSPVVAAVPVADGPARYPARYLTPADGAAFSEAVRRNLLRKHLTLYGAPPGDGRLTLSFDPAYLARSGGGTKLIAYKDIQVRGAFAPFTLSGSAELIRLGYEAGLGEKNAGGFGMVEVTHRVEKF